MRVVFKHYVKRIKNGFAARSPILGLVAHGPTPDLAARNLERTVLLYLRPFERSGTLQREVVEAGLETVGEGEAGLTVEAML